MAAVASAAMWLSLASALCGVESDVLRKVSGSTITTLKLTSGSSCSGVPGTLGSATFGAAVSLAADSGGNVGCTALAGQTQVQASEPMPLTLDGQATWLGALSAFSVLDRAAAELQTPNRSGPQVAQTVADGLRDVDAVAGHMQAARSTAGAALSRLDSIETRDMDRDLWAKSVQSDAEDLDMIQAISEFQNQQTGYQAALQSYAIVQRLSLFDYLK